MTKSTLGAGNESLRNVGVGGGGVTVAILFENGVCVKNFRCGSSRYSGEHSVGLDS